MNVPRVHGREALLALGDETSLQIGRRVLFLPGVVDETDTAHGSMPEGFSSKDKQGADTTESGRLTAFSEEVVDSAELLSLAFAGPPTGGTGSHIERTPQGLIEDLMSANPKMLQGRIGAVHLVDPQGWEPHDISTGAEQDIPLRYVWRGEGAVAILGTGLVTIDDIEGEIRRVADPSMEYYQDSPAA